jgi:hypothetical protein
MRSFARLLCVSAPLLLVGCQTVQTPDARRWGTAEFIGNMGEESLRESLRPDVAMDPNGNAVAVWDESRTIVFDSREDIWFSRYSPGVGRSDPDLVEINNTGPALFARVAMDGSGNAVAVWHQQDGDVRDIWANRYTPSDGWSIADSEPIETEPGDARRPEVAMDPDGNAVAVWYQADATGRFDVWSNRYTPNDGWTGAELIEHVDAGDARWPQVAMDSRGNAVVVWQQCDGEDCDPDSGDSRWNISSNRYTSGVGWDVQTPIDRDAGDATRPHVAVDANGNAVAVWQQEAAGRLDVWARHYAASSADWEGAELIETLDTGDALRPQVAMDPHGNAVAVWSQDDGTSDDIWSNRYTPSGGWGMAQRIEGNDSAEARRPKIAMDPDGSAVVVWTQPDGVHISIWSNRYTPSFGWGAAEPIENWDRGRAREVEVAMDPNGNAVAVWSMRVRGNDEIWFNRLAWPDSE